MTDSDSLRGDIDRHTNLPQCCGELEILRALLRPRMAEAGDPTPTEALRGMFIEIERLRVTTSEGARCQALEESLTAVKHTLQTLRGRLHELLQLSMDGASDRDIFERIESLQAKLAEERKRTNILAEEATAEGRLARAAADGHDHARAFFVAIAEVFGRVDDLDSLPAKVRELSDNVVVLRNGMLAAENLHRSERARAFTSKYADERVQAHIEHAKKRVAEAEAALALLGWDRAQDMTTWARSSAQPVAAARWSKICEAFGFDPEEDPPVSIPAVLAGDRWTNTRRMLADACANMRAPSLEVILGELVQTLSKARGANKRVDQHTCTACTRRVHEGEKAVQGCSDCYWLEFGDAPPAVVSAIQADALTRADLPLRARCPVCHRMARVKDGCFQAHASGDKPCAGSANSAIRRDAVHTWREWLLAKDMTLHADMHDSHLRVSFDAHAAESRRLNDERIDGLQKHIGDLVSALNEKIAALDAVPTQISALKDTADAAHAAMKRLGWDGSTYPDEWASACFSSNARFSEEVRACREKVSVLEAQLEGADRVTDEVEAMREAVGVPTGKPVLPYLQHAAKGMQALAILGWKVGHPVEWATKRAAAEADLRGAFAEAELVGNDHAAMVRQLWGNLRRTSAQHLAVIEERNALVSVMVDIKRRLVALKNLSP